MWCIVDCNNFFVSCERALNPELAAQPVVVLSSGDGCIVARSNESKAMGVKMGMPLFEMKKLPKGNGVIPRSGQMRMYHKISDEVMAQISEDVGSIFQYSIDESFFQLTGSGEDIENYCRSLVKKIWKNCSIPVSIGIATSKTLAKIASKQAKLAPELCGVCSLYLPEEVEYALKNTPLSDIWGVGRRTQPKLIANGYVTAYDLSKANTSLIDVMYGKNLRDTVRELKGEDVIVLNPHPVQKSISLSRTFPKMITDLNELSTQVANFAEGCAEKLRTQHSVCGEIGVFVLSNRFRTDLRQYENYAVKKFEVSCSNSIEILNAAMELLKHIYQEGIMYKKAGVFLNNISPDSAVQTSLFDDKQEQRVKYDKLTSVVDSINNKLGKNAINFAIVTEGYTDGDAPAFVHN